MQSITLSLPEPLLRSARQIAEVTQRPIEHVIEDSIARTLPPLDDVPQAEVADLAALALLDDASLWRESRVMMPMNQQVEMNELLDRQSADELNADAEARLQTLLDVYGRLTLHKSHAWLLLARRGYRVPPQEN
ncbi:MAG: hypothetical protein K1X65_17385 [Caldilineales bacterium]|nr:hypothetical protein [Caldilineales bacterium]MCW5858732.1 hypothetical protein [Caldilineales bacterium]